MKLSAFKEVNQKIEDAVVGGYKKIEDGVVSGYQKIEDSVVAGYKKVEDKFIDAFLTKEGESTQQARERMMGAKEEESK